MLQRANKKGINSTLKVIAVSNMEGGKNDDLGDDKSALNLVENPSDNFYLFNEEMKNDFNPFNDKEIHTAAYSYYPDGT